MSRSIRIYTVCYLVFELSIQLDKIIIKIFADINFVVCFLALKKLSIDSIFKRLSFPGTQTGNPNCCLPLAMHFISISNRAPD